MCRSWTWYGAEFTAKAWVAYNNPAVAATAAAVAAVALPVLVVQVIQAGMFDQKSTGQERRNFLEALLYEDEEDKVSRSVCARARVCVCVNVFLLFLLFLILLALLSFSWVVTNSQCMPEYVVWHVCVKKIKKMEKMKK